MHPTAHYNYDYAGKGDFTSPLSIPIAGMRDEYSEQVRYLILCDNLAQQIGVPGFARNDTLLV